MSKYYEISKTKIEQLRKAGFKLPHGIGVVIDSDQKDIFIKLLFECFNEAYIHNLTGHNNALTTNEQSWTIEDFQDGEERTYENLGDGLVDTWIRNQDEE